ncbi:MAG: InlB B-repeat-containing protein [Bacilli bacterium]|nr:InlB B-repeat-containing protein [Bacilli bacterium]
MKNKNLWIGITLALVLIAAVILFFILRKPTYTVTFSTDGTAILETQNVKENDFAVEPTVPTKEGYVFAGWYLNGERFDFNAEVTEDIVLVARWTKESAILYTIKFDTNGGNKIDNIEVEKNSVIGKLPTPTKKGYEFKGWFIGEKEITKTTIATKDMNLIAKWEKESTTTKKTTTKKKTITTKTTTTKPTTTASSTTTKTTTTKPMTTTSSTTTKITTTKAITTTSSTTTTTQVAPNDELGYKTTKYKDSNEQIVIYLTKNKKVVSGTCDILTTDGQKVTKHIGIDGYITDNRLISDIINIKVD